MERIILGLVAKYESGTLSRRQLVGSLLALLTTVRPVAAAGLKGAKIDRISLQVSDPKRSQDFYANVFGMAVRTEPRPDNSVRLDHGESGFFVLRRGNPIATVDHVAIGLERFEKETVIRQLKELGLNPIDDTGGAGFHIVDPDGFNVQIQ
jgi:catechol 2,3-dioxygenase-like lactoylglutathione lyase family enzyme